MSLGNLKPLRPQKQDITFLDIKAIKLAPGDLLIVQHATISQAAIGRLRDELTKQFWGLPNKFVLLESGLTLAVLKPIGPIYTVTRHD